MSHLRGNEGEGRKCRVDRHQGAAFINQGRAAALPGYALWIAPGGPYKMVGDRARISADDRRQSMLAAAVPGPLS
jgi:hypothetical protein